MKGAAGERRTRAHAAASPHTPEVITEVITCRPEITRAIGGSATGHPRHQEVTADGAA
jgi:hypothetical protein